MFKQESGLRQREPSDWVEKMDRQVLDWLWSEERPASGPASLGVQTLRVLYTALGDSLRNRLPFQASALTFISLLSLVPALAISFSIAKGLGFSDRLRGLLLGSQLTSGQGEILERLLNYVDRTQVGTLGVVGLAALVITLVFTLSSVEETFNRIWGVREMRSWPRKFADYLSVLVISPLLIVVATGAWAGFSSHGLVQWLLEMQVIGDLARLGMKLLPLFTLSVGFVFMYQFLPNTRIPWASALWGGLTAAVAWWVVQSVYISFQVGVARYNAIYGGFASLPLFMVWIQVSWTILLSGAQLAHAHSLCRAGRPPGQLKERLSLSEEENLSLMLMWRVAEGFHRGDKPTTVARVAAELSTPAIEVREAADRLVEAGLLSEDCDQGWLRPTRSLDSVTVLEISAGLRGENRANGRSTALASEPGGRLMQAMERARAAGRENLGQTTLLELVKAARSGGE